VADEEVGRPDPAQPRLVTATGRRTVTATSSPPTSSSPMPSRRWRATERPVKGRAAPDAERQVTSVLSRVATLPGLRLAEKVYLGWPSASLPARVPLTVPGLQALEVKRAPVEQSVAAQYAVLVRPPAVRPSGWTLVTLYRWCAQAGAARSRSEASVSARTASVLRMRTSLSTSPADRCSS